MTDTDRVQIVHLDKESIGPDIDFVLPQTDHLWTSYDHTPAELVIPRLADADIVVLNKVQITRAHLEALPKLKYIILTATGFDKIDIQACHEHNVTVSNARGYARHTVPEHTIALIFALRRSLAGYHLDVHNGVWQNSCNSVFLAILYLICMAAPLGLSALALLVRLGALPRLLVWTCWSQTVKAHRLHLRAELRLTRCWHVPILSACIARLLPIRPI